MDCGNPLSDPNRVTPVEDLSALGFGTLTHQKSQDVLGRGVWQNGRWNAVFSRPLASADPDDTQLAAGKASSVAFAVWNGSDQEVGARKQLSSWVTLQVEGAGKTVAATQAQPQTGAIAPAIPPVATGVSQLAVLLIFLGTLIGTAIVASVFWKALQDTKK
jgi:cytochrome b558/566 subunit A